MSEMKAASYREEQSVNRIFCIQPFIEISTIRVLCLQCLCVCSIRFDICDLLSLKKRLLNLLDSMESGREI